MARAPKSPRETLAEGLAARPKWLPKVGDHLSVPLPVTRVAQDSSGKWMITVQAPNGSLSTQPASKLGLGDAD